MKSITDLPDQDLYPLIFRNLSIDDLFNCRLVNKQFKYFSDNTNGLNKLIIGEPISMPGSDDDCYWYYNNELIDDKDVISYECFKRIGILSIFNLEKNLKYLKIYDRHFKSKELSNLINLESIEFGCHYENYDQQTINLNNLKVFAKNYQPIKLNTPKLEKIKFNYMNQIELDINPELIKHLITRGYDHKLEIFTNLEIIELKDFKETINENLLIVFKNLKKLKISMNYVLDCSYEILEDSLIKILNDKIKLRREIDIYLEGVKIENIDKFNELKETTFSLWKFKLNNYDLLDLNVSFINQLYYEELEECVNNIENDLPSNFFDKFKYINDVFVVSVNVNGLNWFLNNLKYLTTLATDSRELDEVFYNNIPNTIKYLTIYDEKDLNYDFILKLSKLIEFETYVDKDLFDLAFTSFLNLKYLNKFRFRRRERYIVIEKRGKYFLLDNQELEYNQLIIECNKIRSK